MNLDKMTFEELAQLKAQIDSKLSEYKPFTIKEVWRKCGKENCRCSEPYDPCDCDSKEHYQELNLHGPYLYATWRENGKTKTASLGRKFGQEEITAIREQKRPNWYDKPFVLTEKRYKNLSDERRWQCYERTLTERDYVELYGVSSDSESGDKFRRKTSFYFDRPKYEAAEADYKKAQELAYSKWSYYGVGNIKALATIKFLEGQKYFFKPE